MANSSINWSKRELVKAPLLALPELGAAFFGRDTLQVARELLGKVLISQEGSKSGLGFVAGRIVETEAYRSDDPASHSCNGRTPRSSVMFGEPGVAYVYFIYGMYEMLNFVTEPEGKAGAVLIRAIEPLAGEDEMKRRRKASKTRRDLTSGPGKLCRAFGIEMKHNGQLLKKPGIWVVDDGYQSGLIKASPRVGISKGKEKLWRYYLDENSFVSRSPLNKQSVKFKPHQEL